MTNTYHAQPYNIDAEGFYFKDYEDYLNQATGRKDRFGQPVEEFELQFIDGDKLTAHLFRALSISQASLKDWFDKLEDLDHWEHRAACYLAEDLDYSLEDILSCHFDDVFFFEGTILEYAYEEIDSSGLLDTLPESLRYYFDYEAFARDLILGGDVTEWQCPEGNRYIVREA